MAPAAIAGMTTSPQFRESPETAKCQVAAELAVPCWAQLQIATKQKMKAEILFNKRHLGQRLSFYWRWLLFSMSAFAPAFDDEVEHRDEEQVQHR